MRKNHHNGATSMRIDPTERAAVIAYFNRKRPGRKIVDVRRPCYDYYVLTDSLGVKWKVNARG
jgi:hypothetical protein